MCCLGESYPIWQVNHARSNKITEDTAILATLSLTSKIFATLVKFLVIEGFASLEVACNYGTKIETNTNRYSFVRGMAVC